MRARTACSPVDSMSLRFFHKLGATQALSRRAVRRGAQRGLGRHLRRRARHRPGGGGATPTLNVVWGNNATVTNLHLVRAICAAKRKGGRLVVIDPLRTKIAEQADLHLALRPGTDVVLGFALAAELERRGAHDRAFIAAMCAASTSSWRGAREWPAERAAEVCGVPAEQIRSSPAGWRKRDPLVMAPGNGLERGRNGGSGIRAAIALPALLGKLGRGSGIVLGAGNAFPKTPAKLTAAGPRAGGHAHAQHHGHRPASRDGRHRSAAARAVHLQPQPDRRASRPEPDEARRSRARTSSSSASRSP